MARYRGPKSKISRKFREPIFGIDKAFERKKYGPGMHGPNARRKGKQSEYSVQLAEKQKAKYTYGILERQFRKMFEESSKAKGITGEVLLQKCESRLDNVIFRMGVAPSRRSARQLVNHRHILVNGEIVNIPSYSLNSGDKIEIREKSKSLELISSSLNSSKTTYPWIEFDKNLLTGVFIQIPQRDLIPENIKENFIVELYSK